ncbi:MAG TPA: hypothetical protein VGO93_11765 [Candidatus Xenobia bacterium]|jgi:hypothetical protein
MLEMQAGGAGEYATPLGPEHRDMALVEAASRAWMDPRQRSRATVWAASEAIDPLSEAVWALIDLDGRPRAETAQVEAVGQAWQAALQDHGVAARLQEQNEALGEIGYMMQEDLGEEAAAWLKSIVMRGQVPVGQWRGQEGFLGNIAAEVGADLVAAFTALCEGVTRPPAAAQVAAVQSAFEGLGRRGGEALQREGWEPLYVTLQGAGRRVDGWLAGHGARCAPPHLARRYADMRRSDQQVRRLAIGVALLALGVLLLAWVLG